jgi:hypothetical protein
MAEASFPRLHPHKMDPEKLRVGLMTIVDRIVADNEVPGSGIGIGTEYVNVHEAILCEGRTLYAGDIVHTKTKWTITVVLPHVLTEEEAARW